MTLAEPLVAALRVCPTGRQAEEFVPMPVLMSRLSHKMWDPVVMSWRYRFAFPTPVHPAAGIADRVVLVPRDLVLPVTRAGFPTPVAVVAENWTPVFPMLAVAEAHWSPVFPTPAAVAQAAVSPVFPMLAAVVAENWTPAYPMLAAVAQVVAQVAAQAAASPACPNRLLAAAHSGPRPRAAVSLAYPMHQLVALAAPRDYQSPVPVDSSHLAQPVVPGVANQ